MPDEREIPLIDPPAGYARLDEAHEARMQFYALLDANSRARLHKWFMLEVMKWSIPGPQWSDRKIAAGIADSIIRHLAGTTD